jgi:EAL domain-containing protein (putative c-di-GMP-specific phosphodiesterase class I)
VLDSIIEEALCGCIVLYREPVVDLHTGQVSHYEVLCRFLSDGVHVRPARYLADLEKHGFMDILDRRVIRNLFTYLNQTGDQAKYAVNISGQTINIDQRFTWFLNNLVREGSNLRLIVEVTESTALDDTAIVRSTIEYLKQSPKFLLALDDFGGGAFDSGSLDLEASLVKIHGKYARRLPSQRAIVDIQAITSMAHERGSRVVLEWVETKEQADLARELGIDLIQGWVNGEGELLTGPIRECSRCSIACARNETDLSLANKVLQQEISKSPELEEDSESV